MRKVLLAAALFLSVLAAFGCGSAASNTNTNVNTEIRLDPANMPPGLSATPMTPLANTPGIPANTNPLPIGKQSTPGIPGPAELKKVPKTGLTPTPGIPDQETIRKQMGQSPSNANAAPSNDAAPKMKANKKLGGKL